MRDSRTFVKRRSAMSTVCRGEKKENRETRHYTEDIVTTHVDKDCSIEPVKSQLSIAAPIKKNTYHTMECFYRYLSRNAGAQPAIRIQLLGLSINPRFSICTVQWQL